MREWTRSPCILQPIRSRALFLCGFSPWPWSQAEAIQ